MSLLSEFISFVITIHHQKLIHIFWLSSDLIVFYSPLYFWWWCVKRIKAWELRWREFNPMKIDLMIGRYDQNSIFIHYFCWRWTGNWDPKGMIYSSFFFLIILSHHLLSVNTSWKKINNKWWEWREKWIIVCILAQPLTTSLSAFPPALGNDWKPRIFRGNRGSHS